MKAQADIQRKCDLCRDAKRKGKFLFFNQLLVYY